jgi:hypothetical protein
MLRGAADSLDRYAYVLTKSEWKSGRQLPTEEILVNVVERPREVHMRWIGRAKRGQEVDWSPKRDRGRITVRPAGMARFLTLRIDPLDGRATRESRHPVSDTGVASLLGIFERTLSRLRECGLSPVFFDLGPRDVRGQPSRCVRLELPKQDEPGLYAYQAEICLQQAAALPTSVRVWDVEDGAIRLVEHYQYSDWRIATSRDADDRGHASDTGGS